MRIETGHVPPDEVRTVGGGRGEMEGSFGPTRHVSQPGCGGDGDKHSPRSPARLHSGRGCQYSAASAVCF